MGKTQFNPLDFSNKKIMVTGASSGIGRATAIYLSKLGAQLVLIGRNEVRLKATLDQLSGENHILITADLAELEDMKDIFIQATIDEIKLDGLVHSAGIPYIMPLKNITRKRLIEGFNINYFAFIELCRQYEKPKFSNGGSIVGVSSMAAERGSKCQTVYSATKSALDISVQTLALELTKKNIRINSVAPGMIFTEIVESTSDLGGDYETLAKLQLLGVGEPEDVAASITFLLSNMSKFITGRRLFVDGGSFL